MNICHQYGVRKNSKLTGLALLSLVAVGAKLANSRDNSEARQELLEHQSAQKHPLAELSLPDPQIELARANAARLTKLLEEVRQARAFSEGESASLSRKTSRLEQEVACLATQSAQLGSALTELNSSAQNMAAGLKLLQLLSQMPSLDPAGFWAIWYLNTIPDVDSFGVSRSAAGGKIEYNRRNADIAAEHYLEIGLKSGKACSLLFDPRFYAAKYADVVQSCPDGQNLYVWSYTHWHTVGAPEGRDGSQAFGAARYLREHPHVNEVVSGNFELAQKHFVLSLINEVAAYKSVEKWVQAEVRKLSLEGAPTTPDLTGFMRDIAEGMGSSCIDAILDLAVTTAETVIVCGASAEFPPAVLACERKATNLIIGVGIANIACINEALTEQSVRERAARRDRMGELMEKLWNGRELSDQEQGDLQKDGEAEARAFEETERRRSIALTGQTKGR